ncbi:hypothetical protein RFI_31521 [Reticulomyxa filosa]|uniref:Uncharacterized protein n=1 Tax=Reticulomyxa filosa TaxID=46433 RepID=X6LYV0_RETFI|nr:hypothetical protein RFI_31521 [Reticulomyxa filosa]|eukprot:ETO05880.1 hypothetical protein RFI_31521 [Reticulomyxa filosa]
MNNEDSIDTEFLANLLSQSTTDDQQSTQSGIDQGIENVDEHVYGSTSHWDSLAGYNSLATDMEESNSKQRCKFCNSTNVDVTQQYQIICQNCGALMEEEHRQGHQEYHLGGRSADQVTLGEADEITDVGAMATTSLMKAKEEKKKMNAREYARPLTGYSPQREFGECMLLLFNELLVVQCKAMMNEYLCLSQATDLRTRYPEMVQTLWFRFLAYWFEQGFGNDQQDESWYIWISTSKIPRQHQNEDFLERWRQPKRCHLDVLLVSSSDDHANDGANDDDDDDDDDDNDDNDNDNDNDNDKKKDNDGQERRRRRRRRKKKRRRKRKRE